MDREARLQAIYDDAGRPGAAAFRFAVRRAGLSISETEAKAFVPGGGREDQRFQMDVIDFSKRIAKINQGHKFVLVAVDNYNREIFTQAMPRKTAEATLEAFRKITRANDSVMPKQIDADLGNEYALLNTKSLAREEF